jgi:WD40 repeat protein
MARPYTRSDDDSINPCYAPAERSRSVEDCFSPLRRSGPAILIAVIAILISPLAMTTGDVTFEPEVQIWADRTSDNGVMHTVLFSQDGKTLAAVDSNCHAVFWEVETGRRRETQPDAFDEIRSLACSPDGKTLAGGKLDSTVVLWDCESLKVRSVLRAHTSSVNALAFSPDGETLASVDMDGTLILWRMTAGYPLIHQLGSSTGIVLIAFSPCGGRLAISYVNGDLKIRDLASTDDPYLVGRFSHARRALAFSPDGCMLAAAGLFSPEILLWDLRACRIRARLSGGFDGVPALAFSPDGRILVSAGNDGVFQVWDVAGWRVRTVVQGHRSRVWTLAFSPDGRFLTSGGKDHFVRLWDFAKLICL